MTTQSSTRGVLGGAKTMLRRRRESRSERIARQREEREERKQQKQEEREAAAIEEETAAPSYKKKGKKFVASARAARAGVFPSMNANRWTGVIIWLVGAYLTRQFLMQLGVSESYATPFGFVIQWILTKAESPLWQGNGYPRMALFATLIDGGINSGGAWPYMKQLGGTDVWVMINDVAGTPGAEPTLAAMLICAIGVGLATAASAEYFWNL
jgi:hypothetical protein